MSTRFVFYIFLIGIFSSNSNKTNDQQSLEDDMSKQPSWLREALKDIAYYLRNHKFNEYDRRYEKSPPLVRGYYKNFPKPPLRSLHWEVHKYCEQSFLDCIDYLRKKLRSTDLKRKDDTNVVIQQQQWNWHNNSEQIENVDRECKKMAKIDNIQANPFEGPIERFQWRTTATYYMCWFTMRSEPALKHLSDDCDNFANCLEENIIGSNHNHDIRANDSIPFSCASYSFCPDPCCPLKHLTDIGDCWNTPDNPCYQANPVGQRGCYVERSQNTDFNDLILNRWNVSCSCPQKGYVWNSFYGICVDVDECTMASSNDGAYHNCDPKLEICLNLPGSFKCTCRWGHIYNTSTKKCQPSRALLNFITQQQHNINGENLKNQSIWDKFYQKFLSASANRNGCRLQLNLMLVFSFVTFIFN